MKLTQIVFASRNLGKISEMRNLLAPLGIEVKSAIDLDLPDVEETGQTFEENAALKACAAALMSGLPALADDSGLCVNALDGRPGVYSARYAPDRDFKKGMEKLLAEMEQSGRTDRSAYFACVLVLAMPQGSYEAFEGRVAGAITTEPAGEGGFGYDPVFIPEGEFLTFAQLGADVKNKISHRGRAVQKLLKYLED